MPAFFGARRLAAYTPSPVATPWTPAALGADLLEWWEAGTGVATDGSSWTGRNGTVGTGGATYSATARNGKPGVLFDGQSYFTFNAPNFPVGSAASTILVSGHNDGTNPAFGLTYGAGSGDAVFRSLGVLNGVIAAATNNNDHSSSMSWSGIDACVIWQITDGANPTSTLSSNGALDVKALKALATSGTSGVIGGLLTTYAKWSDVLQQILVINRVLTTFERQKLEGWESWNTGKAGANLPASHPYKSRAPLTSDP